MGKKKVTETIRIGDTLEGAKSIVSELQDEMESWKDSLESNEMEHLPKYEEVEQCYTALEEGNEALDQFDDLYLPSDIADQEATYVYSKPYGRKPMSRADRLAEALAVLELLIDALADYKDEVVDEGAEFDEYRGEFEDAQATLEHGTPEEIAALTWSKETINEKLEEIDVARDMLEERATELDDSRQEIETARDELMNTEFPGMF